MRRVITVCGSMSFFADMMALGRRLEAMGYSVLLPESENDSQATAQRSESDPVLRKRILVNRHLAKITRSDAILIANFDKKGIQGYVGSNTLIEIAFAYAFHKPVVLLHAVGEQPCKLEVLGMQSANLNGRIVNIKSALNSIRHINGRSRSDSVGYDALGSSSEAAN